MTKRSGYVALVATIALACCASAQSEAPALAPVATPLLETGADIAGVPFAYPTGAPALVTAVDVVFPPGARTGWHRHDVPLFNHVLAGELTVTYEGGVERVYRAGDTMVEAVGAAHWGRNDGAVAVRLLSVVIGAEGVPYTVETPAP
jgi:quercetin dioxygenase-like cupin family protein